jgi:hypothetical protein
MLFHRHNPSFLLNAAGSDAGSTPPRPTGNTGLDINAKVNVGGKELTLGELIAAHTAAANTAAELATYKSRWDATQTVLKSGDDFTPQTEAAFRRLLSDSGYDPAAIEDAVAARKSPPDDAPTPRNNRPNAAPSPNPANNNGGGGQNGPTDGWSPAAIKTYTEFLQTQLQTSAEKALTESPELLKLLQPLVEAARTDSTAKAKLDKAKADLLSDVRRESVSELQRLQGQLGSNFKAALVPETVSRVAKTLGEKYSQYGDIPGHVGKVTTVTPEEKYGIAGKTMQEPEFKPGVDPQKLADQTREFNEFVLLKAAADVEREQSTKASLV